jgi:signal transduction histidine kinase
MIHDEFKRSLMLIADRDLLINNIRTKVVQIVPIEKIVFFLFNTETEKYVYVGKHLPNDERFRSIRFTIHSKMINWLSINETGVHVSRSGNIISYFTEDEQALIRETAIDAIFPLRSLNRLNGFVMLGRRMNNQSLSTADFDLLRLLFEQVAIAIENSALYEEQNARLRKMYRADRLAILGQLAAGAAHEIRNPLTTIRSTVQYLGRGIQDDDRREMIEELMDEVDRINRIVQGLLSFAKPAELEMAEVDIVHLIRQTLVLLNNTVVQNGIEVVFNIALKNTVVTVDASQLKQVLLNIILNAIEAMENSDRKTLTIEIEAGRSLDYQARFLLILITDSGKGIESADIENIFTPFYTTKKDGTGLGLSISYSIVNHHGGEMEIRSLPNEGTTVTIKLPQTL